jgi:hypothetical protein
MMQGNRKPRLGFVEPGYARALYTPDTSLLKLPYLLGGFESDSRTFWGILKKSSVQNNQFSFESDSRTFWGVLGKKPVPFGGFWPRSLWITRLFI